MVDPTPETPSRDARVHEAIVAYLAAVEAGQAPNREELLSRHLDVADELRAFFADYDRMQALADPLRQAMPPTPAETPTVGPESAAPGASLGTVRYFGDYELLEEIARGGMGVVYRARQVSLNRVVALKMILAGELASAADVRRFRQEAENAATLDHPHIVPIYEVGEHQGQQYFSMRLIEGGSLASAACGGGGGTKPQEAARLMATVARAVYHAHQRGILHRDLKPANILLDVQGQPHVTDFGLAKRVEGGASLSQSGAIIGTPSYMAPEQAAAKKDLSVAVDVYSLGAILYEMLTGQPPFRAATPLETLLQVMEKEPTPPRSLNQKINRDLETIALKCLSKVPAQRYASAEALADELDRFVRGEPILARPVRLPMRAWRWCKRKPWRAAAYAVILSTLSLAVGQGVLLVLQMRGEVYQSLLREADAERKAGNRQHALELLRQADHMRLDAWFRDPVELRQQAFETVASSGVHMVCEVECNGFESDSGMFVSEDGQTLCVRSTRKSDINQVFAIPTGELLREKKPQPGIESYKAPVPGATGRGYSSDGRWEVLEIPDKGAVLWDRNANKVHVSLPIGAKFRGISNNFRWVVLEMPDKGVVLWDTNAKEVRASLPMGVKIKDREPRILNVDLLQSDNGRRIAFRDALTDHIVRIWDWDQQRFLGTVICKEYNGEVMGHGAGFSPDGALLALQGATHGFQSDVLLFEVETGALACALHSHQSSYKLAVWSKDGRWLITAGGAQDPKHVGENSPHNFVQFNEVIYPTPMYDAFPAQGFLIDQVLFRPDGKQLLAGNYLWDVECGEQRCTLRRASRNLFDAALHGGRFAFAGTDELWVLPSLHSLNMSNISFGPNNARTPVSCLIHEALQLKQVAPRERNVVLKHPGWTDPRLAVAGKRIIALPAHLKLHPDGKHAALVYLVTHIPVGVGDVVSMPGPDPTGFSTLEYWDLERGERLAVWNTDDYREYFLSLQFSPDGKWLATLSPREVSLWDTATGKRIHRLPATRSVESNSLLAQKERLHNVGVVFGTRDYLTFSNDGSRLACMSEGDKDGKGKQTRVIEDYDTATGQKIGTRPFHWGEQSPDGQLAADFVGGPLPRASGEEMLCLKDAAVARPRPLVQWHGHETRGAALAFSPDGKLLATLDNDGVVKLWNLPWIRQEMSVRGFGW
jgi:WD40 repeat protein